MVPKTPQRPLKTVVIIAIAGIFAVIVPLTLSGKASGSAIGGCGTDDDQSLGALRQRATDNQNTASDEVGDSPTSAPQSSHGDLDDPSASFIPPVNTTPLFGSWRSKIRGTSNNVRPTVGKATTALDKRYADELLASYLVETNQTIFIHEVDNDRTTSTSAANLASWNAIEGLLKVLKSRSAPVRVYISYSEHMNLDATITDVRALAQTYPDHVGGILLHEVQKFLCEPHSADASSCISVSDLESKKATMQAGGFGYLKFWAYATSRFLPDLFSDGVLLYGSGTMSASDSAWVQFSKRIAPQDGTFRMLYRAESAAKTKLEVRLNGATEVIDLSTCENAACYYEKQYSGELAGAVRVRLFCDETSGCRDPKVSIGFPSISGKRAQEFYGSSSGSAEMRAVSNSAYRFNRVVDGLVLHHEVLNEPTNRKQYGYLHDAAKESGMNSYVFYRGGNVKILYRTNFPTEPGTPANSVVDQIDFPRSIAVQLRAAKSGRADGVIAYDLADSKYYPNRSTLAELTVTDDTDELNNDQDLLFYNPYHWGGTPGHYHQWDADVPYDHYSFYYTISPSDTYGSSDGGCNSSEDGAKVLVQFYARRALSYILVHETDSTTCTDGVEVGPIAPAFKVKGLRVRTVVRRWHKSGSKVVVDVGQNGVRSWSTNWQFSSGIQDDITPNDGDLAEGAGRLQNKLYDCIISYFSQSSISLPSSCREN